MGPSAATRRTQAERSATTRDALLDATISSLVEDGYVATTTSRVAKRAGVSRGAHLHHFQTRTALVVAAMDRLTRRRGEELSAAAADLPPGREGVLAGLDLLWGVYANPLFQGALALWTHARTDPELRGHLQQVERALDRQTLELARRLFPAAAQRPDFDGLMEMTGATVRGLSLLDTLHPGSKRNRRQWAFCRRQLADLLDTDRTLKD